MLNKKRLILLTLVLTMALALTACFDDELVVIDSNIIDYDLNQVPTDLDEVVVYFNNQVADADVAVERNQEVYDGFEVEIDGTEVIISNLNLKDFNYYDLSINATDVDGAQVMDQINFVTEDNLVVENPNDTMFQTFYWEIGQMGDDEANDLWNLLEDKADEFAELGFTSLWLPPAQKAWRGVEDIGYGVYDLWDLGEFEQPTDPDYTTVRTRYGYREDLESALEAIDAAGLDAYYDVVFNHRMGAEDTEKVKLSANSPNLPGEEIEAWTYFDFEGRDEYYSRADEFNWNHEVFDAVDWAHDREMGGTFLFDGKEWDNTYGDPYLMGTNVHYQNEDVVHEMKEWGQWIINDIGFDGFRMDAIKHVDSDFTDVWIDNVQESSDDDIFFVAEAWENNTDSLIAYLEHVGNDDLTAFDFPLRSAFQDLSDGILNMQTLSERGLVNNEEYGARSVTFVDNHDTDREGDEYGDAIQNRKLQAYTYILTHDTGLPKVYWRDYYVAGMEEELNALLGARERFAYGPGREAENTTETAFGYVREGSDEVSGSGLVSLIHLGQELGESGATEVTFTHQPDGDVDSVSIAGSFNDWDPNATPMEEVEPGVYEITKTFRPGEYEYKFVEDGDNWIEPEGADKYTGDGHGGENAVLDLTGEQPDAVAQEDVKLETMEIDSDQPNTLFVDYTGNVDGVVRTDEAGVGEFKVEISPKTGWSVWVPLND